RCHVDTVCGASVRRSRRRTRSRRRKRYRGYRHCGLLLVDHVSDEQARRGVLLPAEKREMNLPEVIEAGRSVKGLHHGRLSAFASAIIHDGNPRVDRMDEHLGIRGVLPMM